MTAGPKKHLDPTARPKEAASHSREASCVGWAQEATEPVLEALVGRSPQRIFHLNQFGASGLLVNCFRSGFLSFVLKLVEGACVAVAGQDQVGLVGGSTFCLCVRVVFDVQKVCHRNSPAFPNYGGSESLLRGLPGRFLST